MSGNANPVPTPDGEGPGRRRGVIVGSVIGGVVVLGVIAALVVSISTSGQTASPTTAPSMTTSASASSATPAPTTSSSSQPTSSTPATPDPVFGAPVAGETTIGSDATVAGATVRVESVTPEDVAAQGPGVAGGTGVRVTIRITNASSGDLDLSQVQVNAFTGEGSDPASPVTDDGQLSGSIPAGGDATGSYLFTVPDGTQNAVTVTVGVAADSGILVFRP